MCELREEMEEHVYKGDAAQMELPPGFCFHPTDEELITHYLSNKVSDASFNAIAIGEVDLNKCEPWDLPWRAKMGEKEWYFFCVRDRKYPTGLRTNRATESGYWKATGKDKDIYRGKSLVGMKKTLVFYRGRAPKGEKSNWVMHEYRLEGKFYSVYNMPKTAKNEWVICRVFKKGSISSDGKKGISSAAWRRMDMDMGMGSSSSLFDEVVGPQPINSFDVPNCKVNRAAASEPTVAAHVTCFSNSLLQEESSPGTDYFNSPLFLSSAAASFSNHPNPGVSFFISNMKKNLQQQQQHYNGSLMQLLLQSNNVYNDRDQNCCKQEKQEMHHSNISQETGITTTDINPEISSIDAQPAVHLQDCLWTN